MAMRIIAGKLRGRRLQLPAEKPYRPTSGFLRSRVFDIIGPWRIDRANFLDLCAGSGAMGFEALSRGASRAYFVEVDHRTCNYLRKNIQRLGVEDRATVLNTTFEKAIELMGRDRRLIEFFDFVFFDPPYDPEVSPRFWMKKVVGLADLMRDGGELFLETPRVAHMDEEYLFLGGGRKVSHAGVDGPEVQIGPFELIDERITGSTQLTRWRKVSQVEMLDRELERLI